MDSQQRTLTPEELDRLLGELQTRFGSQATDHPAVVEFRHQAILNSADEEGLKVHIIVSDDTPIEKMGWRYVQPIEDAVRQKLEHAEEHRFIYFSVGTRKDADEWSRPVEDIEEDEAA